MNGNGNRSTCVELKRFMRGAVFLVIAPEKRVGVFEEMDALRKILTVGGVSLDWADEMQNSGGIKGTFACSGLQYIFVSLAEPLPQMKISRVNTKSWQYFICSVYAKRTNKAKDSERESRICVIQPGFVYDVLRGVDVAKALEKWEILFVETASR